MSSLADFFKDPDALLDYSIDWSHWLATGESILTSTWAVPTGLTNTFASHTTSKCTVWLSGGSAGDSYTITNHITTDAGRTDDRSIVILCRER